ncbi:MAG: baseplate J/gp47 family protein [Lachnospirales bacterium]
MYENITYENILKRMLEKVPKDMDKREGSIIYDAIAPCAVELQLMYIELDVILKETFGDTASRSFLIRRGYERGLKPYEASASVLKGVFNVEVPEGSRFSCYDLNYVAREKLKDFEYSMECETVGVIGNKNFGKLIPIDYIEGLSYAELSELLIPGEDEEDTEKFRLRYFNSFDNKAYGGNRSDYLEKVNAIEGVGGVIVTPCWQGGGTVLVTIQDSTFNKASDVQVATVQEILDPVDAGQGKGFGVAPIGHIVTVNTVGETLINVSTKITFDSGYYFDLLEDRILEVLETYLEEERKKWSSQGYLLIRIAYIEARLLDIKGILDIGSTKLNGVEGNLILGGFDIPILGGVVCES